MTDMIDIPDLASDLSAIAMYIIKSDDPGTHGELQEAFAAALAPFGAENQRLREARAEGWRAGREAELDQKLERMLTKWESPAYQHVMLPGTHMTCDLAAPMIRAALRSTEASHDD